MTTRIGIIGAGAVACVVGGLLTNAGHGVGHLTRDPKNLEPLLAMLP